MRKGKCEYLKESGEETGYRTRRGCAPDTTPKTGPWNQWVTWRSLGHGSPRRMQLAVEEVSRSRGRAVYMSRVTRCKILGLQKYRGQRWILINKHKLINKTTDKGGDLIFDVLWSHRDKGWEGRDRGARHGRYRIRDSLSTTYFFISLLHLCGVFPDTTVPSVRFEESHLREEFMFLNLTIRPTGWMSPLETTIFLYLTFVFPLKVTL